MNFNLTKCNITWDKSSVYVNKIQKHNKVNDKQRQLSNLLNYAK